MENYSEKRSFSLYSLFFLEKDTKNKNSVSASHFRLLLVNLKAWNQQKRTEGKAGSSYAFYKVLINSP